ncbi:MAG: DUF5678 domain-containing protein [Methanocellales archaeon]|nr:DUF5678 domain-containing protein [Methanocellales archaeon]
MERWEGSELEMSEEEEIRSIIEGEQNGEWLASVYDKIKEEYSNKFIAVKDGSIIADNDSLPDLLEKLASDEKRWSILIEFIGTDDFSMIL